jgi:MacB-like periplasmic core domain
MIRSLLKNWKLNSTAVFSLAIAMALSVLALSVSDAMLLRPPLAHDAERLVTLYTVAANGAKESFSYPDYLYVRDHSRVLSAVAALNYGFFKYGASYGNYDELATLDAVSDNYFEVIGIQPFPGRFQKPTGKADEWWMPPPPPRPPALEFDPPDPQTRASNDGLAVSMRESLGDEPAIAAIEAWADAPVPELHKL